MLITNGTVVTPGVRRRTIQRQVNLGPFSLRIVTVIIIAAIALVALAQSTHSATKGYREQALKQELTEKQEDIDKLKTEEARLKALHDLKEAQATASPAASPTASLLVN